MNERIKAIRIAMGLTQEEFGKRIGLTKSGISAIENGSRSVTDKHIILLTQSLNVSESYLRSGTPPMFTDTDRDIFESLEARFSISPMEKHMIETFLKLPGQYRQGVIEYIKALTKE